MDRTDLSKPVILALFILLSVFAGIWYSGVRNEVNPTKFLLAKGTPISVAGVKLFVDVADNKKAWEQGLSGRESMPPLRGMLFVFPTEDYYKIWMKGMRFPIDVLWIDKDGYIVDIWEHAMPDSYPGIYTPNRRAKYILETVADFVDEHNIDIGDKVTRLPR